MGTDDRKIKIAELFDDDADIYADERGRSDVTSGRLVDLEVHEQGDKDEALVLDPGSLKIALKRDDYGDVTLEIEATVENQTESAVELGSLFIALRTSDGDLLDHDSVWINTRFARSQEIVSEINFDQAPLRRVRRIDLYAQLEYEFQALVATAELDRLPLIGKEAQRHDWPLRIEMTDPPNPSIPRFELELVGAVGVQWDDPFARFLVKLTELTPSTDLRREVVLALRDGEDRLVAKSATTITTPYPGYPSVEKVRLTQLSRRGLANARRLDVAAKGRVERVVHLGSFTIRD